MFSLQLVFEKGDKKRKQAWIQMTFKPSLVQRLMGRKNVIIKHPIDISRATSNMVPNI